MFARSTLLKTTTAFGVTLLAIVACGPQKESVPFRHVVRSQAGKAVQSCHKQIPLTKEVKVIGETSVRVCELPSEDALTHFEPLSTSDEAPAPVQTENASESSSSQPNQLKVAWVDQPVRFKVVKKEDRIELGLDIGLQVPSHVAIERQKSIASLIINRCVAKVVGGAFERSTTEAPLALKMKIWPYSISEQPQYERTSPFHQVLKLTSPSKFLDQVDFPEFQLANRPGAPSLFPSGEKNRVSECDRVPNVEQRARCVSLAIDASNEPFCKVMVQMVGEWLGLAADPSTQVACQSNSKPSPQPKAQGSVEKPGFMKAVALASPADESWKDLRFSASDITTILSPACDTSPGARPKNARLAGQ